MDPLVITGRHAQYQVKFAAITSGANESIVAAVTGKKIRVLSLFMTNSHATNASASVWESPADTAISGTIALPAAGGKWDPPPNAHGWIESAAGQALVLDTTAGTIGGHLTYIEV